jgi:hypothetical protein
VRHDTAESHTTPLRFHRETVLSPRSLVLVQSRAKPTQTLNLTFLYVTVSTLNPTVGIVVTLWFNLSLYRIALACQPRRRTSLGLPHIRTRMAGRMLRMAMEAGLGILGWSDTASPHGLVLPAASRPSIRIRISLFPNSLPMLGQPRLDVQGG